MNLNECMMFNFSIPVDKVGKNDTTHTITNMPIVINGVPVGVITDVKFDDVDKEYDCLGIIWSRFIHFDYSHNSDLGMFLSGITILK